jgi:3-deoxy-manno-octulosonate cytidylyltransferase (CMP-KDO synthetase)
MLVIGIIPVRMNSSRFPGKPMKNIHNMPMIGHCYYRTMMALGKENTYVATCDTEIRDYILSIGGKVIMTSDNHTRATTRTAEAMEKIEKQIEESIDIVIMIQGDEPLIDPKTITKIIPFFEDKTTNIVNIMARLSTRETFEDVNNVKVVVNCNNDALYFSREAIPSPWKGWTDNARYMQTGIIAFRREMLIEFNSIKETLLEQTESVDMNRVLETGGRIKMVLTESTMIGVDVPEELSAVEEILVGDSTMMQYL